MNRETRGKVEHKRTFSAEGTEYKDKNKEWNGVKEIRRKFSIAPRDFVWDTATGASRRGAEVTPGIAEVFAYWLPASTSACTDPNQSP